MKKKIANKYGLHIFHTLFSAGTFSMCPDHVNKPKPFYMLNYFYIFNSHLYTCSYQNRPKYTNSSYHYRSPLNQLTSNRFLTYSFSLSHTLTCSSTWNEYFYCSYAIAVAVLFFPVSCSSLSIDRYIFFFLLSSNCDNKFMQRFAYTPCSYHIHKLDTQSLFSGDSLYTTGKSQPYIILESGWIKNYL